MGFFLLDISVLVSNFFKFPLKINEYEVPDMMGYMKALSKFKKGDAAVLRLNREEKIIEINIIF